MAPERPLSPEETRQVLEAAWKLQGEKERQARTEAELQARVKAGAELGLDPSLRAEAEAMVRMQSEGRAIQAKARRARIVRTSLVAGVGALLLALGTALLFTAGPLAQPTPIVAPIVATDWRLETSPGTVATVAWAAGEGTVTVDQFTVQPDGRYWANLESDTHPDWTGLRTVTFSVRGEGLQNVRLYLENPTERWRGPVVPVTSTWQSHSLPLDRFEHQVKDGSWTVVADAPPRQIKTTSFKLGWYVNEADARGSVSLKDLHAE